MILTIIAILLLILVLANEKAREILFGVIGCGIILAIGLGILGAVFFFLYYILHR